MRPANLDMSASFSRRLLEFKTMVFLRSSAEISVPIERRSSFSISSSLMAMLRPIMPNWMRFLRSDPSQKFDWPSASTTVTKDSCAGSSCSMGLSRRRRARSSR